MTVLKYLQIAFMNAKNKVINILNSSTMFWKIYHYFRGFIVYLKYKKNGQNSGFAYLTYRELVYLSYFSKDKFLEVKTNSINYSINRIKNKKNCKVGFLVYTTSMWSVDGLYQLMEKDSLYEPTIIVVPFADASEVTFANTKDFFTKRKYRLQTFFDTSFNPNNFDILIYTNPYVAIDKYVNILSLRLDKLVSYVSYSYILSGKSEKLDLPVYYLSWKFFCDSEFYKKFVEDNSRIYSNNAVFCGYPKMDDYYTAKIDNSHSIGGRKVVMYAPHQSVNRNDVKAATFEMNGWYLLYLAERYKDKIFWIIKPHPLLRSHSVEAGIFNEEESYSNYLKKWEETGAAIVLENGDYFDLFKESDAMMTDSISFLAEYQFTGKPLLLLESGKQTYNEFGNNIREILYRCKGNDYEAIERFLNDLLENKDPMKPMRDSFFEENLSYGYKLGHTACDNLFGLFKKEVL